MYDVYLRKRKEEWLCKVVNQWPWQGLDPNTLTVVALGVGLSAAGAVIMGAPLLGLALWLLNRFLDGLDGTLARAQNKQSAFGGYLDLILDYLVYLAVPISFVIATPTPTNLWTLVFLLATFYVNTMSWAGLSALLEQQRHTRPDRLTTLEMPSGLVEGAETIFFYSLLFLFPNQTALLFAIMGVLVFVTVGQRLWWAFRQLPAGDHQASSSITPLPAPRQDGGRQQ